MGKYFVHTFGCQMNEYDSRRLSDVLEDLGWEPAETQGQADLLIANTCTVRKLAEEKAFSMVGRWAKLKQDRPQILIGMIGCLAQHLGDSVFKRAPVIDFIAGPRAIAAVPELIDQCREKRHPYSLATNEVDRGGSSAVHQSSVSDFVAVMDGCDQYCTYCAVPLARGREKSRPVKDIIEEVERKIAGGAREITLLGQNITRYGMEQGGLPRLDVLLESVASVKGLLRLRFLTGHPGAFTEDLIRVMAENPRVCEAMHLPLQSGSDRILKAMNRGYSSGDYVSLVEKLRKGIPNLVLTTDLITGFPGETEEDFLATLRLVETCRFDAAFCFKYSVRKGTAAEKLPGHVSREEKEKRLDILLKRVEAISIQKKSEWIGKTVAVLIESRDPKTGRKLQGRTRGNFIVNLEGPLSLIGKEIPVEIIAAGNWSLMGMALDRTAVSAHADASMDGMYETATE